jgi:hypothetical protein
MADGGMATKKTRRKSREGRFLYATVPSYYGDRRLSLSLPLSEEWASMARLVM